MVELQAMLDIASLNSEQRSAATDFFGPTLVLAGAGTGKTRVITYRIAYMLAQGVPGSQIAAMTFTNKAAREMRERVRALVGPKQAKTISIGTFHSFCINILRRYYQEAGVAQRFSLIATSDQLDLVTKALEEKSWANHFKADSLLFEISTCKNWMITPDQLRNGRLPRQPIADAAVLAEIYELYERQLALNRAIDFDDCIYKVVTLLKTHESVRVSLGKQFQYLLVDEFQDTNSSQFAVIEELAKDHQNICVVGDDDQSIYSWRGAMYETMQKFEATFKNTQVIKLEQNYRCTNVILNAANSVIKNNTLRMEKTLWSAAQDETPIVIAPLSDAVEEARWVGTKCIELLGLGHRAGDIAILYRSNAQAKLMEMALRECSVPSRTFGGQSFFERKEVKTFLGYLRLVANPEDRLALWRIINTPVRGIGLKTQEQIERAAFDSKTDPFSVLSSEKFVLNGIQNIPAIQGFVEKIAEVSAIRLETPDDMEALGSAIIRVFQLEDEVRKTVKNVVARHHKIENLKALPRWLKKSSEDMVGETGELDAYQLLDRLTMSEAPPKKDEKGEANYVSLMTIHAAKGLEFPVVFVVGCEEELLPHKNSVDDPNGVSEERRLFYVALTRAKKRLHLSYAHMRQTGFQKAPRRPSRFLNELPDSVTDLKEVATERTYEEIQKEKRDKTLSRLAKIRESLMSGEWS
jgi:superfamily I DNA/RNA helicase